MREFSGVKLIITIICAVIVMTFFGSVSLFIDAGITSAKVGLIDEFYDAAKYLDDESSEKAVSVLTEIGENFENQLDSLEESFEEDKEIMGEDFPAEGLFLYRLICVCQSNEIISTFEWCFGIGILIGTCIYFIVIRRATGKKLIKELIIAAIVLVLIMLVLILGYEAIFNLAVKLEGMEFTTSSDYTIILKMLLLYIVCAIVVYIINCFYEKMLINSKDKTKKVEEINENKKEEKTKRKSETSKKKTTSKKTSNKKGTAKKESK